MIHFLLDTNILSCLVKWQQPHCENIHHRILQEKHGSIAISSISLAEISLGLELLTKESKKKQRLTESMNEALKSIKVIEFNSDAAWVYGTLRAELIRQGKSIETTDALIAAHAIASNITLITNNYKHFQRISNLKLENWAER